MIIIFDSKNELYKEEADLIAREIKKKKNLVIGLATGRTMIPLYEELEKLYNVGKVDFSEVTTFNLDEYIGLPKGSKKSLYSFMKRKFFDRVNLKKNKINFLDGSADNFDKECEKYEQKIKRAGGIDLQILGLGVNGHIAFNEPHSSFKTRTRKVKLSSATIKANSLFFGSLKNVPKEALTMGIGTIMQSKKILLIATGRNKRKAVERFMGLKISEDFPASVLHRHKNFLAFFDKESAAIKYK